MRTRRTRSSEVVIELWSGGAAAEARATVGAGGTGATTVPSECVAVVPDTCM